MAPRMYTVETANEALPEVRRLVRRIVDIMPTLPEMHETVRIAELKSKRSGAGEDQQEQLARAVADLRAAEMAAAVALRSLDALDVTLKDSHPALVALLSARDRAADDLCWS